MSVLAGSTVLVTGGCGFIGSHLVRRLLAEGARRVIALDSLRYGSEQNLAELAGGERLACVRFELGSDEPALLDRHLEGVDHLFHLAAEKHNQSKHDPDAVLRANVLGTHQLFAAAVRAGVKKTVFSSSLYSYGRLAGPPSRETDLPLPTTVYGISKLCGERLLAHHAGSGPMRGDSLRFFFVYGPRQFAGTGYKSVIVKNFERIRAGQPPVIFGDGSQRLDYVFVEDVVDAALRCMESPDSGRLLNVGIGGGNLDQRPHRRHAGGGGLPAARGPRAAGLDRGKLAGRRHRGDPRGAGLGASRLARRRICARPGAGSRRERSREAAALRGGALLQRGAEPSRAGRRG